MRGVYVFSGVYVRGGGGVADPSIAVFKILKGVTLLWAKVGGKKNSSPNIQFSTYGF